MTQPLNDIVQVTVEVSPTPAAAGTFNIGLIVGTSNVVSTSDRSKVYSSTDDMTSNGWTGTEPEYKAATLYFDQSPRPSSVVIGRQGAVTTQLTTALTSGTAYTTLEVDALTEDIASGSTVTIGTGATTQTVTTNADAAAGATTIDVNSFTANAAYAIGAQISAPETALEAVTACRSSNTSWYGAYGCGWSATDIESVAAYVQTATPPADQFYDSSDPNIINGVTPNVMSVLQADKYGRNLGIYSTTQYAGAAVMGYAMGANTGLVNSAFTLNWKSLVGVTPETLTTTEYNNITGYNGNVYTTFGSNYELLSPGVMADGTPFDQVLNIDQITGDIQTAAINALTGSPKIPQTTAGVQQLVAAISAPCENARTKGVVAAGTWTAAPVLTLQTGATLPRGYIVLADSIANQSQADRTARKSPPIYVCLKMAGAIEHVVIGIIVNQ